MDANKKRFSVGSIIPACADTQTGKIEPTETFQHSQEYWNVNLVGMFLTPPELTGIKTKSTETRPPQKFREIAPSLFPFVV